MSLCVYNLMGRIFNSELELDNFLLNHKLSIQRGLLSDIVFDKEVDPQRETCAKIDEAYSFACTIKEIRLLKARKSNEISLANLKLAEPYLGVTAALKRFVQSNGKRFTPEFLINEYGKRLQKIWSEEGISPEMMLEMGIEPNPDGSPKLVKSQSEFNRLFKQLLDAWNMSARVGSALHKVFELFWNNHRLKAGEKDASWYMQELDNDPDQLSGILTEEQVKEALVFVKMIKAKIESVLGPGLEYYPEYPVVMDTTYSEDSGQPTKLLGIIDLLVVDKLGNPHIFDYKFSSKAATDWASSKELMHKYQQGFYRAGISSIGINTNRTMLCIIPIQMDGFNGKLGTYEQLAFSAGGDLIYMDHSTSEDLLPYGRVGRNILNTVVLPETSVHVSLDFIITMEQNMARLFPGHKFQKDMDDAVKETLRRDIRYNKYTNKWTLPDLSATSRNAPRLEFDSEQEAIEYLDEYHQNLLRINSSVYSGVIGNIKRAINGSNPALLASSESPHRQIKGINPLWFYTQISRYCTKDWEIPDGFDEFESLGIIVLHNVRGNYYNFIVIDNQDLDTKCKFKMGEKITANFTDDVSPAQFGVDLLDGNIGNIDNMKVMLAINTFYQFLGKTGRIGEIFVMNPRDLRGMHAGTNQLIENFRMLCSYAGISNNFDKGNIKTMNYADLARETLFEFGQLDREGGGLNTIYSEYEANPAKIEANLRSLYDLKNNLERAYPNLSKPSTINFDSKEGIVYLYVLKAIQSVKDVYHVQEIKDGNSVHLMINAPATLASKNLLDLSKTAKEVYRLMRADANKFAAEFREHYDKFRKAAGYGTARRLALNDETTLFKNMYRDEPDQSGVFRFKLVTDPTLKSYEKEFLTWALDTLYKLKHPEPSTTEETIRLARENSESDYYDVPLLESRNIKDKVLSEGGRRGMLSWIKDKIEWFKHPIENIKRLDINSLTKEDSERAYADAEKYRIFDIFTTSDDEQARASLLREKSVASFDHDLGNIMYNYMMAKVRKKHLDNYLPILQAYTVVEMAEANANNVKMDSNISYIQDFIKAKILDLSLVPDQYKAVAKGLQTMRDIATYSTLGFSPKAYLFQRMEGVWKSASRSVIRPMGVSLFGWKEVLQATKFIEGETPDHKKIVCLGELINECYGLNDQDMNSLAEKLKQGMLPATFTGQMMFLTSSPDYYNRMIMFVALMIKDGCFKAHKVVGTKMVYDWKLDDRFSVFANANGVVPTDPEKKSKFFKQKALYIAKMEELLRSGYKITDEDGNERELKFNPSSNKPGDALPMAYTFNEANNLKSFSDQMYGYYNHEDQFMLKSYLLGASYTQFRTFWSSLYNRWFIKGDVYGRTNGEYVQQTINKTVVDVNGNETVTQVPAFKRFIVDPDTGEVVGMELTDEDTGEPAMGWKGSYQEGIAITLWNGFKSIFNGDDRPISEKAIKFVKGDFDPNANEDVKRVRLTNMLLFAHDILLWAIIGAGLGTLLTELLKKQKEADKNKLLGFGDMTVRNAESILVSSLVASTLDLGAVGDLASPLTDWTPPSFRIVGNIWNDGCKVITGDETFSRAVLKNIGVARQTQEYWYKATALTKD